MYYARGTVLWLCSIFFFIGFLACTLITEYSVDPYKLQLSYCEEHIESYKYELEMCHSDFNIFWEEYEKLKETCNT